MAGKTFFDAHLHAFNLSHPSFSGFVSRLLHDLPKVVLKRQDASHPLLMLTLLSLGILLAVPFVVVVLVLLAVCLVPVYAIPCLRNRVRSWGKSVFGAVKRRLGKVMNLLFVMENDIGSMFLLVENCLRDPHSLMLCGEGLHIGNERYTRIVLTPLMMDFGYKSRTRRGAGNAKKWIRYDVPGDRPIVEQVVDLFRGIRDYVGTESDEKLAERYPALGPTTRRVFEIYPFLGLNPANYTRERIGDLLEKYFAEYTGRREDFRARLGQFDGDIEHLGSHFFAGIKVYPPLGFDPWPEEDEDAMAKVELLYTRCSEKGIPLTTHGGSGGFVAVDREDLTKISAVAKWAAVLRHYPDLKLNLAHFPPGKGDEKRRDGTIELVLKYANVYVDVSCRATSDRYYQELKDLLQGLPAADAEKLRARILFGTDFAVNLMWTDSYNQYLGLFSHTPALTPEEKHAFCSVNPERFLFR
jgi:predicted TIM-barrel fold metal-dependent hydrolase